jgi:predicted transcriptional regulator
MVSDIMTIDYPAVTPNDSIDYCMTLMTDNNIRYLPVFENHQVCSIISISDVVKETIQGQAETISQLKDYLHSNI